MILYDVSPTKWFKGLQLILCDNTLVLPIYCFIPIPQGKGALMISLSLIYGIFTLRMLWLLHQYPFRHHLHPFLIFNLI